MAELQQKFDRVIQAGDVVNIEKALDQGASPDGDKNAGKKPIHFAVETGLVQITELLCERGANLNVANPEDHGRSPLHMATVRGFNNVVKYLLEKNADPDFVDNTGETPLITAIQKGELSSVALLLKYGADVHKRDANHNSAMLIAVEKSHGEIVQMLLKEGASAYNINMSGDSTIHVAARKCSTWILERLRKNGCDINKSNRAASSPLHLAAESGNLEAVQWFLLNGAKLDALDAAGKTAADRAADARQKHVVDWFNGHKLINELRKGERERIERERETKGGRLEHSTDLPKACVKEALSSGDFKGLIKLIEKGTDVDTLIYENNDQGMRAVHYAAQNGNMEMLRALKQSKVDLKPVTRKGFTALHCAVLSGQLDAVRWLVAEAGFGAACRSKGGETALDLAKTLKRTEIAIFLTKTSAQEAIRKGDLAKVRELVAGGFDANAVLQEKKNKECRPLHLAADGGHVDIVKILLQSGAQAEAKNSEGMTPLHLASWGGHAEVIKVLLGGGANGNARTNEGMTAVHLASMGGHVSSMEALTPTYDILSVTREGKSALHLAAEYGNLGAVEWLHLQGLDPSSKDHSGQTPLQYAKDEGHKKVVEYLKRYDQQTPNRRREKQRSPEALAQGAGSKDEEAVRKPLDQRANPERPGDLEGENGSPGLHAAASVGHVNVIRDLLKAGAPKDAINEMGLQAVHCAAKGGHIEALKLLKESECDLTTRTPQGATTLHCAAEGGHVAAVQWLLEHSGLSLDSLNNDGDTALDVARKNGRHNTTTHLQEAKHQRDLKKLQEELKEKDHENSRLAAELKMKEELEKAKHQRDLKKLQEEMKEKEHEITRLAAELKMKEEQEKEEIKQLQAMLKSKDEEIKHLSRKQRKVKH